ncbi:MFS transporter [Mycolicibacterium vaccae]|uniref:Transporter n=1 Tax=Mycolicibacterium vaccae ATCC 25954 TaxID=1194972 RepID=K0UMU2_MYCVA|nr:MFS transporter [Mycolicibacterium vaccae]ANI41389.1 transporter [Mycolicibacterium vaccae 95051]EJZ08156.1 transporter [Mycolicibacterium vaccae ATCC 25954]MCV7059504.1 MFS transporter [Mycolicibacterium vaccae]
MAVTSPPDRSLRANLPALLCLAAASCLAVSTEMLPVGLLPQIGAAFQISDATAGLLVGLYAVMVATLAVPLTVLTIRFARKPLLMVTVAGYAVSNAVVAVAPVFALVAAGRALGGITHALFFSLVIGYAPRLVPRALVGRALALAASGASVGLVLGVPLLTSLGTAAGWRMSFVALTVLSVATLALLAKVLPPVGHDRTARPDRTEGDGRARLAAVAMSNMLVFLGQFTVYTFVSVMLLAHGARPALIGPILLVCGACGLLGLWYAGRGLDRNPRRTTAVLLGMTMLAVICLSVPSPGLWAVLVVVAVWCTAFGGVPSIYQSCAVRTGAMSPERAGAWINATSNAGIAGGSAIGAGLLGSAGLPALPWAGAALIGAALAVALLSPKAFPSQA